MAELMNQKTGGGGSDNVELVKNATSGGGGGEAMPRNQNRGIFNQSASAPSPSQNTELGRRR
jgi:hypothetical protein